MDPSGLLELFDDVVAAVDRAVAGVEDRRRPGRRAGQYDLDLAADDAALELLDAAGVGVLSEESGLHGADADVVVVIDPVDGSTNCSRGIPWYATSLCAVDAEGPLAAVVTNLASGERFSAIRGQGAWRGAEPVRPSGTERLDEAMVAVNGRPPGPQGWKQYRCLGAAALDLCLVGAGVLDGYVDWVGRSHGAWDYMGALLVCWEAGVPVADAHGDELVVLDPEARRSPVAGATPALLHDLLAARRAAGP